MQHLRPEARRRARAILQRRAAEAAVRKDTDKSLKMYYFLTWRNHLKPPSSNTEPPSSTMRMILQLRQDAEADMAAATRTVWPAEAALLVDIARGKFAAAEELCSEALQKANPEHWQFDAEFPLDQRNALRAQRDAVRSARTQLDLVDATLRRARD
jgi:hypothetical protein